MTIYEQYENKLTSPAHEDMKPRMADLRRYGKLVKHVTEFGVRTGNSTSAFLAAGAEVRSFDIEMPTYECPSEARDRWRFIQADTANLDSIPYTDLLFIDTFHTAYQVSMELMHESSVGKYILLHDVIEFGFQGEDGGAGINLSICQFLRENPHWKVKEVLVDRWGLLVLERIA